VSVGPRAGDAPGRGPAAAFKRALHGRAEHIALGLAALALALTFLRPTASLQLPQVEAVVVFDITQSMSVADVTLAGKPATRLALAKAEMEHLLPLLPCGSRLGWAIFTDHRSLLLTEPVEVCEHRRELVSELRRIEPRMAWEGNSEVAKGLNSGLQVANALEGRPALVFVSDGHEAPPISPNYRPAFSLARGKVRGVLVGVGGDLPVPIPKFDPVGRSLGVWEAKDVLQVDPRSLGRAGNRESMVDEAAPAAPTAAPQLGAMPGSEHLSSLREGYLQLLATEAGLSYQRLHDARSLYAALTDVRISRPIPSTTDLRPLLGGVALLALLWPLLGRLRRRPALTGQVPAARAPTRQPPVARAATRPQR
jgi:mxaL protein